MSKRQDPYSLENVMAAIDLAGGPGMTDAEKRAVLERMTADVERLTAEAKAIPTSTASNP
jgi:hypothetical protein